jgi:predicted RNase H-like HicB family nuclease
MHKYEVVIYWSEDDGVFVAEVPELSGCTAHGESPAAAISSAQEAIDLWLQTAEEFGREIPLPKSRRAQTV